VLFTIPSGGRDLVCEGERARSKRGDTPLWSASSRVMPSSLGKSVRVRIGSQVRPTFSACALVVNGPLRPGMQSNRRRHSLAQHQPPPAIVTASASGGQRFHLPDYYYFNSRTPPAPGVSALTTSASSSSAAGPPLTPARRDSAGTQSRRHRFSFGKRGGPSFFAPVPSLRGGGGPRGKV